MRKWIPAILILAAVIATIAVYPRLPEQVPTHWSISGEVNGWSSRLFGAWMMPLIMAVVWLFMRAWCTRLGRPMVGVSSARFNGMTEPVFGKVRACSTVWGVI